MKATLVSLAASLALVLSGHAADVSVTISKPHLCCGKCVTGANKAVATVTGLKANVDKDADTIELTAGDKATLQKGVDALVAAGYFGISSDPTIKVSDSTGAKNVKVQSLKITDMHLCCASCIKAVDKVVKSVPGANAQTAVVGGKTFEITGDFNDKDMMDAFQKAGLTGKVGM